MPLALGEFLDVPQVTSNRSNIARLDHNACIPDCERLDGHLWSVFVVFFNGEQKGHGEISHLQNDSKPGKLLRSGLFLGSFPWEMFLVG